MATALFAFAPSGSWMYPVGVMIATFCVILYFNPKYFLRRIGAFCLTAGLFGAGLNVSASITGLGGGASVISVLIDQSIGDWVFGLAIATGALLLALDVAQTLAMVRFQPSNASALMIVPEIGTDKLAINDGQWRAKARFSIRNTSQTEIRLINLRTGVEDDSFSISVKDKDGLYTDNRVAAETNTDFIITGTIRKKRWHRSSVTRRVVVEDSNKGLHGPFQIRFAVKR
ncbi:MAG: hypothetical protein AAGJ87_08445 [Pseudomonadota bacterium]